MPKKTLIITAIIVALITLGATAAYISLKQEGEKVRPEQPEQPVGTLPGPPELPVVQPQEPVTPPEQPTTPEPIDTSDWKTYRNEKYGFELKYPEGWYYIVSDKVFSFYQGKWKGEGDIILIIHEKPFDYQTVLQEVKTNAICLSATCTIDQFQKTPHLCKGKCEILESTMAVGDKEAKIVQLKAPGHEEFKFDPLGFSLKVYLPREKASWFVSIETGLTYSATLYKMLSTFRFYRGDG